MSKKSSKKFYIRVDKPIEPGDLVRCVRDDRECKPGDVRKVSSMGVDSKVFFYVYGSGEPRWQERWEPVHKLKVGDRVVFEGRTGYPGKICTVSEVNPSTQTFNIEEHPLAFSVTKQIELYRPEKHDPKPVRKEAKMSENHRADMKQEVAEMIVELLDREGKENCFRSSVSIFNWRYLDNTVTASGNGNKSHTATLSPSDTWDTLTGVYVALSKATGRKLPDWIYGGKR